MTLPLSADTAMTTAMTTTATPTPATAAATAASDFVARRQFAPCYIWLDIMFLVLYAALLLWRRRRMTVLVGLVAGLLYFAVDFGIFHLALHTRSISPNASLFWVLAWMSMSYGFTNFSWIWLYLRRDDRLVEWSTLIFGWWFCAPLITQTITSRFLPAQAADPIVIQRTTGAYHGWMALILFAGYAALVVYNLGFAARPALRVDIRWLLVCGIGIQFAWELALLLGGIRSAGLSAAQSLRPLVIDSLLETNLGMPYVYLIFLAVSARWHEDLGARTPALSLAQSLEASNMSRRPFTVAAICGGRRPTD